MRRPTRMRRISTLAPRSRSSESDVLSISSGLEIWSSGHGAVSVSMILRGSQSWTETARMRRAKWADILMVARRVPWVDNYFPTVAEDGV